MSPHTVTGLKTPARVYKARDFGSLNRPEYGLHIRLFYQNVFEISPHTLGEDSEPLVGSLVFIDIEHRNRTVDNHLTIWAASPNHFSGKIIENFKNADALDVFKLIW